jgi:hypothetical protein
MSSNLKPTPHFNSEDEEREFWSLHDSTDYIDWSEAVSNPVFPHLKPTAHAKTPHTKQRNKQAYEHH